MQKKIKQTGARVRVLPSHVLETSAFLRPDNCLQLLAWCRLALLGRLAIPCSSSMLSMSPIDSTMMCTPLMRASMANGIVYCWSRFELPSVMTMAMLGASSRSPLREVNILSFCERNKSECVCSNMLLLIVVRVSPARLRGVVFSFYARFHVSPLIQLPLSGRREVAVFLSPSHPPAKLMLCGYYRQGGLTPK